MSTDQTINCKWRETEREKKKQNSVRLLTCFLSVDWSQRLWRCSAKVWDTFQKTRTVHCTVYADFDFWQFARTARLFRFETGPTLGGPSGCLRGLFLHVFILLVLGGRGCWWKSYSSVGRSCCWCGRRREKGRKQCAGWSFLLPERPLGATTWEASGWKR